MKGITILRGSRSSHKPSVKYEAIEKENYIIIREKKDKRLGRKLQWVSDDGECLVFADNSKLQDYKRRKQKKIKK